VSREKLRPLVQNTFYGNVGAIAQHSDHFSQTATIGTSPQELLKFVTEFTQRLDELELNERQKQRVQAQLATLEAESTSEPEAAIVKQAACALRNLTEGAIASLLATAVQPTVWSWIHETLKAWSR
jgi:hypothetical protein